MNEKEARVAAIEWASQYELDEPIEAVTFHVFTGPSGEKEIVAIVSGKNRSNSKLFPFTDDPPSIEIPPDGVPVWVWDDDSQDPKSVRVSAGTTDKNGCIRCYSDGESWGPEVSWDNWEPVFEMVPAIGLCGRCVNVNCCRTEEPCKSCQVSRPSNFKAGK